MTQTQIHRRAVTTPGRDGLVPSATPHRASRRSPPLPRNRAPLATDHWPLATDHWPLILHSPFSIFHLERGRTPAPPRRIRPHPLARRRGLRPARHAVDRRGAHRRRGRVLHGRVRHGTGQGPALPRPPGSYKGRPTARPLGRPRKVRKMRLQKSCT